MNGSALKSDNIRIILTLQGKCFTINQIKSKTALKPIEAVLLLFDDYSHSQTLTQHP